MTEGLKLSERVPEVVSFRVHEDAGGWCKELAQEVEGQGAMLLMLQDQVAQLSRTTGLVGVIRERAVADDALVAQAYEEACEGVLDRLATGTLIRVRDLLRRALGKGR